MSKKVLVIGGAGFIGSHFVDLALKNGCSVRVLDALTYAGRRENVSPKAEFHVADTRYREQVIPHLEEFRPEWVVNFAAESHVDRSIENPDIFVETNVNGVLNLLRTCLDFWKTSRNESFRFLQVSTDEVFGDLGPQDPPFQEDFPYRPRSPYSASKAAGDHLVQAWFHTYGLPALISYCCNNYGPRQMAEKLIPHMIQRALKGMPLPVYGDGSNVREWIHAQDHCAGIWLALEKGRPGRTYAFGSGQETTNLSLVKALCAELDRRKPRPQGHYEELIQFVTDRPGHDRRYAIDSSRAHRELGFRIQHSLENGLSQTIDWYLAQGTSESDLSRRGLKIGGPSEQERP
jgi:dTDP-glucose 4,6-dehydratase